MSLGVPSLTMDCHSTNTGCQRLLRTKAFLALTRGGILLLSLSEDGTMVCW